MGVLIYNSASEFGDTIFNFTAGSGIGGDVLDINTELTEGTGFSATTDILNIANSIGLLVYETYITDYTTGGDHTITNSVAGALSAAASGNNSTIYGGIGSSLIFAVGTGDAGNGTTLWRWEDAGDLGLINDGEFTLIATLEGVDVMNLTQDNFEGFSVPQT